MWDVYDVIQVGYPTRERLEVIVVSVPVMEYDADSKKRVTLRNANYEYYHVRQMSDGIIILEPKELREPFQISANTLSMIDKSMENFKQGIASDPIDLSEFEE